MCVIILGILVRERSALSDPYCQFVWNSVYMYVMYVCAYVRNFEVKNRPSLNITIYCTVQQTIHMDS